MVTPRSASGTSAPAQAAAITATSASAAIAPPCTMSAIVTLVGSHGRRSRLVGVEGVATMPSLATNGEDGMNWAMTSAPVWGWVAATWLHYLRWINYLRGKGSSRQRRSRARVHDHTAATRRFASLFLRVVGSCSR